jgi:hypothetical protein
LARRRGINPKTVVKWKRRTSPNDAPPSAVDRPAQEHARMTLVKRADDEQEQEDEVDLKKIASFDTLDEAIAAIHKAEGCDHSEAMSQAAREYPDLLAKYQREGDERASKAVEAVRGSTVPPVIAEWNALVERIARRDMCPSTEAMRRARAADPDLFRRYQSADGLVC